MSSLSERTVRQIFEQAGSTAPAPGAGSVMAMAAAWGVALALKSIRITARHGGADLSGEAAELERLADLLFQDAEDDAAGFTAYVEALRRPKSDPGRPAAIGHAAEATAQVAIHTLEHARAAAGLCAGLEGRIAETMRADLEAARALLKAAGHTAREDARESLRSARSGPPAPARPADSSPPALA